MKLLTITLTLLMAIPAMAQRSKSKTETALPVVTTGGIAYNLPRTGIRIQIKATKTTFVAGPYAAYAESLLGIRDVNTKSGVSWNIDNIAFSTFAEPDPEQRYLTGSVNAALVQLTPDGCLAGINSNATPPSTSKPSTNSYTSASPTGNLLFTNLTGNTDLTGRSPLESRAAAAAATILKSRSVRYDIAAGLLDEFHPDGKAYEESIKELARIERTNLELFTGKSASEEHTFYFDFIPSAKNVKGEVVFRFDESLGFLPKTDFSGKPVMIDVEKSASASASGIGASTAAATGAGTGITSAATSGAASGYTPPGTLMYRQPAMADVKLMRELTVIATTRLPLAQFGEVAPLPEELLTGGYSIEFHPETGSIRSVVKK